MSVANNGLLASLQICGKTIDLPQGLYLIGNDNNNNKSEFRHDICLSDESVDTKHALLEIKSNSKVRLIDLQSINGTFLNDQRLDAKVRKEIFSLSTLRFGNVEGKLKFLPERDNGIADASNTTQENNNNNECATENQRRNSSHQQKRKPSNHKQKTLDFLIPNEMDTGNSFYNNILDETIRRNLRELEEEDEYYIPETQQIFQRPSFKSNRAEINENSNHFENDDSQDIVLHSESSKCSEDLQSEAPSSYIIPIIHHSPIVICDYAETEMEIEKNLNNQRSNRDNNESKSHSDELLNRNSEVGKIPEGNDKDTPLNTNTLCNSRSTTPDIDFENLNRNEGSNHSKSHNGNCREGSITPDLDIDETQPFEPEVGIKEGYFGGKDVDKDSAKPSGVENKSQDDTEEDDVLQRNIDALLNSQLTVSSNRNESINVGKSIPAEKKVISLNLHNNTTTSIDGNDLYGTQMFHNETSNHMQLPLQDSVQSCNNLRERDVQCCQIDDLPETQVFNPNSPLPNKKKVPSITNSSKIEKSNSESSSSKNYKFNASIKRKAENSIKLNKRNKLLDAVSDDNSDGLVKGLSSSEERHTLLSEKSKSASSAKTSTGINHTIPTSKNENTTFPASKLNISGNSTDSQHANSVQAPSLINFDILTPVVDFIVLPSEDEMRRKGQLFKEATKNSKFHKLPFEESSSEDGDVNENLIFLNENNSTPLNVSNKNVRSNRGKEKSFPPLNVSRHSSRQRSCTEEDRVIEEKQQSSKNTNTKILPQPSKKSQSSKTSAISTVDSAEIISKQNNSKKISQKEKSPKTRSRKIPLYDDNSKEMPIHRTRSVKEFQSGYDSEHSTKSTRVTRKRVLSTVVTEEAAAIEKETNQTKQRSTNTNNNKGAKSSSSNASPRSRRKSSRIRSRSRSRSKSKPKLKRIEESSERNSQEEGSHSEEFTNKNYKVDSEIGTNIRRSKRIQEKMKVAFTRMDSSSYRSVLRTAGHEIVSDPTDATIIITNKIYRTYKFMIALVLGIPIVSSKWLDALKENIDTRQELPDCRDYLLRDERGELEFKFSLRRSLSLARKRPIFRGYIFMLTKSISPPAREIRDVIMYGGGHVIETVDSMKKYYKRKTFYVVSCVEDKAFWENLEKEDVKILSTEAILIAAMQQYINFKNFYQ